MFISVIAVVIAFIIMGLLGIILTFSGKWLVRILTSDNEDRRNGRSTITSNPDNDSKDISNKGRSQGINQRCQRIIKCITNYFTDNKGN